MPEQSRCFNDPDIEAMDFLTAVMRDPSVSIADRVHAAQAITQVESVSAIRAIDDVFFAAMMHRQWEDFSAEQHVGGSRNNIRVLICCYDFGQSV